MFRIIMKWEDDRYSATRSGMSGGVRYNEHRETECPSNYVASKDTDVLWKPHLQVLDTLSLVIVYCFTLVLMHEETEYCTHNATYISGWILKGAINRQLFHGI